MLHCEILFLPMKLRTKWPGILRHMASLMLLALALQASSAPLGTSATIPVAAHIEQKSVPTAGNALRVAITLDDLPWHGAPPPGETRLHATRRLLSALAAHNVPATGFVNCSRISPEEPILQEWLSAGLELGNHTSRHLDLDRTEIGQWIADVKDCQGILSRVSPRPIRYFRYPMLHYGATEERRRTASEAIQQLHYTVAHVTIDNSEWLLASAYQETLKTGDASTQQSIANSYIDHVTAGVEHFDRMAKVELGRPIPHILLLHANALAADQLGVLLDALLSRGARFISLQEALSDEVFASRDMYVGPKGLSWLYRIRPEYLQRWGGWDNIQAEAIRQQYLSPSR